MMQEMTSPAGFRAFIKFGALYAGNMWLSEYLPRRWDRGYAVRILGADTGEDGMPFFKSGKMLKGAATRSRARVSMNGTQGMLVITIPAGYLQFHQKQVKAFKRLPEIERAEIREWFRESIENEFMSRAAGKATRLGGKKRLQKLGSIVTGATYAAAVRGMARTQMVSIGGAARSIVAMNRGGASSLALAGVMQRRMAAMMRAESDARRFVKQYEAARRRGRLQYVRSDNPLVDASRRLFFFREPPAGTTLAKRKWFLYQLRRSA